MAPKCVRCDRSFRSQQALRQHLRDSYNHHPCNGCGLDCHSWDDIVEHCRIEGCRTFCQGCDEGDGSLWVPDSRAYWEHVEEENVCTQCGRHFDSPSNLTHHKLTHRTADFECLGCYRTFTTYGGMIIHLESGACDSELDFLDLNNSAAMCYQWTKFIDEDYRHEMLDCVDLRDEYNEPYPYKCPGCESSFPKLSSLFQHVESPACDQNLQAGAIKKLTNWLYRRHG
ncbi:hypothetical protein BDV96DRAFT_579575 [Lophiotrema nucula]|uniref:C2H2-type domain-containing protein n=1 Tax=Lophiotrema nucula TaxID=690887 RepID=A0A6A5Z0U4_9PLEO|nr:hypothetical protein BDV96DRAFT_579575 [Lophiotrema nucula]